MNKGKLINWIAFIIIMCFLSAIALTAYTLPPTAKAHYDKTKRLEPQAIERRRVMAILKSGWVK